MSDPAGHSTPPTKPAQAELRAGAARAVTVMIVDDSLVIRGFISRMLKESPLIDVVASASGAQQAIDRVMKGDIEVVVLDIEMPGMDGITALPHLLKASPNLVVIMASTLTTRNAEVSLRALNAGAADYVPKPTTANELFAAADFKRDLTDKVVALAAQARMRRGQRPPAAKAVEGTLPTVAVHAPTRVALRPASKLVPHVLAIASSTGGPGALTRFFTDLPRPYTVPIVVTQHMPPVFTKMLADNLSKTLGIDCREAATGDAVVAGRVLIAPGDFHMGFRAVGGMNVTVELNKGEKENFCRPAADPMLRSLVGVYGGNILCLVLTGMGSDGLMGCREVVAKGGAVYAQDEASSVVWGMPGAVAKAGLCSVVAPLDRLGRDVGAQIKGR